MLSSKRKSLFVEANEFSLLLASTTGLNAPFKLEKLYELKPDISNEDFAEMVESLGDGKGKFVMARSSVYPKSRFVRRHTLETPAKAKDSAYLVELLKTQFRIDVNTHTVYVLNAGDGTELDPTGNLQKQKELVFTGAKKDELTQIQERLVESGLFPDRIELGTLATLAGLKNYIRMADVAFPVMILEVTSENSNVFIINKDRVDISRPIPYGLNSMFPLIQKELGLKDEASAKKLFYSNTFDFTEMGPSLLKKIMKELQASTGFYEVQTGQTIGYLYTTLLPKNFSWLTKSLARSMGVDILRIDYARWLRSIGVEVGDEVRLDTLDSRWVSIFSMMIDYSREAEAEEEDEPEEAEAENKAEKTDG